MILIQLKICSTQTNGNELYKLILEALLHLQESGVDFLVICTNKHIFSDELEVALKIPVLHIADVAGSIISNMGLKIIGLLGTKFTMTENFYIERLNNKFGLEIMVPPEHEMDIVHNIIYQELVKGKFNIESKNVFLNILEHLFDRGAQGTIL